MRKRMVRAGFPSRDRFTRLHEVSVSAIGVPGCQLEAEYLPLEGRRWPRQARRLRPFHRIGRSDANGVSYRRSHSVPLLRVQILHRLNHLVVVAVVVVVVVVVAVGVVVGVGVYLCLFMLWVSCRSFLFSSLSMSP